MRTVLVLVTLAVGMVSSAPSPRPDAVVAPITPLVYSTPFAYSYNSYNSFVSHPYPAVYSPYAYAYGYPYYIV